MNGELYEIESSRGAYVTGAALGYGTGYIQVLETYQWSHISDLLHLLSIFIAGKGREAIQYL